MPTVARTNIIVDEPRRLPDVLILVGLAIALIITPVIFLPALYDDFTLLKQASLFVAAAFVLAGLARDGFPLPGQRPLRIAVGAWMMLLVLSELSGLDPRGGLLGVYQYRQGFLTQVIYLVLFLGASRAAERGFARTVLLLPLAGLGGVFVYTLVQATGNDPFEWWLDTSDRAIGTIGNANELAAYAIIALVASAPWANRGSRGGPLAAGAVAAASSFIVFEAESRSGIGALVLFVLLLPAAWFVARASWRALLRPAATVIGGLAAGALLSVAVGGLAGSASRLESGVTGSDRGGTTRVALVRGTIETIKAEPLLGAGPDGLWLAFPRHRPADLGGAFESYDLVVQSSHNVVLDTAANVGLPGLAAFGALVTFAAASSVRSTRRADFAETAKLENPILWAGVASYGAITLLNPLSLAAHALFFVVLGVISNAPAEKLAPVSRLRRARATLAVVPAAGALIGVALFMPFADLAADNGWVDYDAQRFEDAANHYERASSLMPLERRYAQNEAESWLAAGVDGDRDSLERAADAYESFEDGFGFSSGEAFGLAAARFGLGNQPPAILSQVDRGIALNPHGVSVDWYVERIRTAVRDGGTLRYSQKDHWTFIEPNQP